jgi:hypothetical protein
MFLGSLLSWIVVGGIVGWVVSLVIGREIKGGIVAYIGVGIVTMFLIGLVGHLLHLIWLVFVLAVVVVVVAGILKALNVV